MGGAAIGGIQAVGTTSLAIACTTWISVVDMSGLQGEFMRFFLTKKVIARDLPRAENSHKVTSRPAYYTPRTPQLRALEMALWLWITSMWRVQSQRYVSVSLRLFFHACMTGG